MYVFLDTETTGVPRSYHAPLTDFHNWPRLVQIAWLRLDGEGLTLAKGSALIKPDGFVIPRDAAQVHGISTERALRDGTPLNMVLEQFAEALRGSGNLVAHNIDFDAKIVGAEFLRLKMSNPLERKRKLCTMRISTEVCRIPGPRGYKWPRLEELHEKLFGKKPNACHDALADVEACAACFFELKRRGVRL